jgi:hypothetical protein
MRSPNDPQHHTTPDSLEDRLAFSNAVWNVLCASKLRPSGIDERENRAIRIESL